MWEIVEAIHKALKIESTWAFVGVIAFGAALIGGFSAWIIDVGYKNSAEYKAEHSPKTEAVARTVPQPATANSTEAAPTPTTHKPRPTPPGHPKLQDAPANANGATNCVGTLAQFEGDSHDNIDEGSEYKGSVPPCYGLRTVQTQGKAPHDNTIRNQKITVGPINQGAGSIAQIGGSGNQATINNFGLADRHLSRETANALTTLVREYVRNRGGSPGITVLTVANGEAESFADELARMFYTLRADDFNHAIVGDGWWPQSPTGVTLNIGSENDSNFEFAKQLADAMQKTGVPAVAVKTNSSMEVGDIYLVVGDKTASDPIGAATRRWLFR